MGNCRAVPPELWAKAHDRLVFYFSRRHGAQKAEDLAQETLAALLSRPDYEFPIEDFLPVCLGFARNISYEDRRETFRYSAAVDTDLPSAGEAAGSPDDTESRILLGQVLQTARAKLASREYDLVEQSLDEAEESSETPAEANRRRVNKHRAIRKLRDIFRRDKDGSNGQ